MDLSRVRKSQFTLNPVNQVSTGRFSSKSGIPLIKFDISSSDAPMYLKGEDIRINGRIHGETGAGADIASTNLNFVDNFAGRFANCIDTVTIYSKRLNQVIERVTNYSRIVPSIMSGLHGEKDLNTKFSHEGDHFSSTYLGRHGLCGSNAGKVGKSFSVPLYCGCLQTGTDIDLSVAGLGGLVIEILLKPDVNVVFGAQANTDSSSYFLNSLTLTGCLYHMPKESAPAQQNLSFNSLSSVFQTINSSASVVALTPGLKQVSAIFMNFMNTSQIGDQRFNSCRLGNIGQVHELRFSVNGSLYPLSYRLQTNEEDNANLSAVHTYSDRTMIDRQYLEAVNINRYSETGNTSIAYNNWNSGKVDRTQTQGAGGDTQTTAEGFGILYDAFGTGEDLSNRVFSFELNVSGNAANQSLDGSAATSQGCTIVFLNKNNIIMSANGIELVR